MTYFTASAGLGSTDADIRAKLRKAFHDAGKRIVVSAFGAFNNPTSEDPTAVCTRLANFAKDYGFDGVDLDYEDNAACEAGKCEAWLITCTKVIRTILPKG